MITSPRLTRAFSTIVVSFALLSCSSSAGPAGAARSAADDASVPEAYRAIPVADKASGIQPPKVIKRVEPETPPGFLRTREYAIASIGAVIGADGLVKAMWYSSGDREWAQAAAAALSKWRFEPAMKDGQPVAVRWGLTVTFRSNMGR